MIEKNFHIRVLTKDDVETFRSIRLEMTRDYPSAFTMSYEEGLEKDEAFFEGLITPSPTLVSEMYGCFSGDEIVGTAGFLIQRGSKEQHKALVWCVYVKPDYRGMKLGRTLMCHLEDNLPDEVELVHLAVTDGNDVVIKLYESLGFEKYGYERKAIKVGAEYFDFHRMVKFLK